MKPADVKLVFFGTSDFSVPVLEALFDTGYKEILVVSRPDAPAGRGQKLTPPPVVRKARQLGLNTLQPQKVDEVNEQLHSFSPSLGVVASYGKLIPDSTLGIFPAGLVNIHPSLLPKYRGPSPVATAILDGAEQTGVTLMDVTAKMDAGGIYDQQVVKLDGTETTLKLTDDLFRLGAGRLVKILPDILDGRLKPKPQSDSEATYTKLFSKSDSQLNWNGPATGIDRRVRAFCGWLNPHAHIGDLSVVVTCVSLSNRQGKPAEVFVTDDNKPGVYCNPGAIVFEKVKPAGKPEMDGRDLLAGYKHRLGL